ncbi:UDP-N-acetylmuramate dehydrogenase [Candidatus Nomurabacteria bacterium]|nr:UDP-N-acetylmuramate dehydrogenase [Candidatus Nomurabacteria bacterium]
MEIQEYVDIKPFSTLRAGGQFRYFSIIEKIEDLKETYNFAKEKKVGIFILGGGSNMVFSDGIIDVLALKIEIKGFEIVSEGDEYTDIKVGAGENWDEIVSRTVDMGLSGLESLSAIPGTVGASPVQNIGAYGAEVKDTILEVEVYEIETGRIFSISNMDCKFGYRDSIFKNEAKGQYVIISVTYRLKKATLSTSISVALSYPGVKRYFIENNINAPTLQQIRETVINIRNSKLPNPKEVPNVGSFFKNPIVLNEVTDRIKKQFSDAKFYSVDDNYTKIPAGWLIENAGLKGESFGNVSVYNKNALVLVNNGNASSEDIIKVRNEIAKIVKDKFGIELEQEPEIL